MSPSQRDWRLHADDIVEAYGKIRRFIAGMDYDAFVADERPRDAVIRNLEIIGEAAKKLPREETAKAPQVPWCLVCGMRDVLAHGSSASRSRSSGTRRRPASWRRTTRRGRASRDRAS
jgi:uncharacterized protein with HEPN domain